MGYAPGGARLVPVARGIVPGHGDAVALWDMLGLTAHRGGLIAVGGTSTIGLGSCVPGGAPRGEVNAEQRG